MLSTCLVLTVAIIANLANLAATTLAVPPPNIQSDLDFQGAVRVALARKEQVFQTSNGRRYFAYHLEFDQNLYPNEIENLAHELRGGSFREILSWNNAHILVL